MSLNLKESVYTIYITCQKKKRKEKEMQSWVTSENRMAHFSWHRSLGIISSQSWGPHVLDQWVQVAPGVTPQLSTSLSKALRHGAHIASQHCQHRALRALHRAWGRGATDTCFSAPQGHSVDLLVFSPPQVEEDVSPVLIRKVKETISKAHDERGQQCLCGLLRRSCCGRHFSPGLL